MPTPTPSDLFYARLADNVYSDTDRRVGSAQNTVRLPTPACSRDVVRRHRSAVRTAARGAPERCAALQPRNIHASQAV